MFVPKVSLNSRNWRHEIIAVAGTFLSLIPLLTEEPHLSPPFPCTTANLPVILWVILDPKKHYQQLKNNSGCLSTGLPP
jgi:hypothetical protein